MGCSELPDEVTPTGELGGPAESWCYIDRLTRGHRRLFSGHVDYIHGTEARRLRGELGLVVADLLTWAADESAHSSAKDDDQG